MSQVISKHIDKVSQDEIDMVNQLTDLTWPDSNIKEKSREERRLQFINRCPQKTCHFIFNNDQVVGYAESFPREIKTSTTKLTILGLGAVCIHPDTKGKGFGAQLVRAAFNHVDEDECAVSLFQTAVPGFYHKLNCRTIKNKIVNSTSDQPNKNPFWDPYIMIYPRQFIGFEGDVDLLGEGY